MSFIVFKGQSVELNEEGFLVDPGAWNEELAPLLVETEEGLDRLTEDHWAVIRFVRGHYLAHHSAPMVRIVCQSTGMSLKRIYELFPSGPAKGLCRIAGLPKPDGCV